MNTHRQMWISIIEDYVLDGTSLDEVTKRLKTLKKKIHEKKWAGDRLDKYWEESADGEF